jgi:NAD(P)H-hydrate repair Nnr-like enzyme with NAD(P)H-hydrate dehydratase domain
MGTAVVYSAALLVMEHMGMRESPQLMTAGDIGRADGSRLIYSNLIEEIERLKVDVLVLHYIMPIITLTSRLAQRLRGLSKRPFIIADAGSMYSLKASGEASLCDFMTPDPGEMAFLADPQAVHPAYVEKHLFEIDTVDVLHLIKQAYLTKNVPRMLVVKGARDYVVKEGQVVFSINEPNVPALEPIGGTGDTLTGTLAGLVASGMDPIMAAIYATKANRIAGLMCNPTPRTPIHDIICRIPEALRVIIKDEDFKAL